MDQYVRRFVRPGTPQGYVPPMPPQGGYPGLPPGWVPPLPQRQSGQSMYSNVPDEQQWQSEPMPWYPGDADRQAASQRMNGNMIDYRDALLRNIPDPDVDDNEIQWQRIKRRAHLMAQHDNPLGPPSNYPAQRPVFQDSYPGLRNVFYGVKFG